MKLATAELVKRKTENGFGKVNDDVPLGRIYTVDLESASRVLMQHESGELWEAYIIWVIEGGSSVGWMFLELLKIYPRSGTV